jgi:hypothetical protein
MTDDNGTQPVQLGAIVLELEEILKRVEQEEATALVVYEDRKAEARRIRQMIATAKGEGKRGPYKKKSTDNHSRVSAEKLEENYAKIAKLTKTWSVVDDIPGAFTIGALAEKLGRNKNDSALRESVIKLREQGRVRLVGERLLGGTRTSHLYVLVDEH